MSLLPAGLQSLNLGRNQFPRLPHALSSATQLTSLSVARDRSFVFMYDEEEVEDVLRDHLQDHLPALQEFNMVGSWVRVGGWVGKVHLPLGAGWLGGCSRSCVTLGLLGRWLDHPGFQAGRLDGTNC